MIYFEKIVFHCFQVFDVKFISVTIITYRRHGKYKLGSIKNVLWRFLLFPINTVLNVELNTADSQDLVIPVRRQPFWRDVGHCIVKFKSPIRLAFSSSALIRSRRTWQRGWLRSCREESGGLINCRAPKMWKIYFKWHRKVVLGITFKVVLSHKENNLNYFICSKDQLRNCLCLHYAGK